MQMNENVSKSVGICSLKSFMKYQDAFFIYNLLSYYIDCPVLLQSVNLYISARIMRPRNLLVQKERPSDIKFKSVIYIGTIGINKFNTKAIRQNTDFDIFNMSILLLKRVVK